MKHKTIIEIAIPATSGFHNFGHGSILGGSLKRGAPPEPAEGLAAIPMFNAFAGAP
jgi:hypothetical protein